MSLEHDISLKIGKQAEAQLRSLEKKIVDKLFENFIGPIRRGYLKKHLEGKYKPSWAIPTENTNFLCIALADFAKKNSLYHYHFGFPFYESGYDPVYPGKTSDAIVHTIFRTKNADGKIMESHSIYHIDPSHHHPFKVPTNINQVFTTVPQIED